MTLEIERKFLLTETPDWLPEHSAHRIEQGYLAVTEDVEIRIRILDDEPVLTVKGGHGEVRSEVEVSLDAEQLKTLWPLTETLRLEKTRWSVPVGGANLTGEVDIFGGDLDGLVVAEVEFGSLEESRSFDPPGWLGEEITCDERFANQSLARNGHPAGGMAGPRAGNTKGVERRREEPREQDHGPSRAYRLKHGESTEKGLPRIASGRVEHALKQLSSAEAGDPAVAIHEARKDLKKLRSLLRLLRGQVGEESYGRENRRYREAASRLGQARDAEVMLHTLSALEERFGDGPPGEPISSLRRQLEEDRDKISPDIEGAAAAIAEGRTTIADWSAQAGGWKLIGPSLRRSYRSGRTRMERTAADPSAENVHEWRKRSKDLWYQLRILRGAWPEVMGELADQTHELAELLGDHHDLEVLSAHAHGHADQFAEPGDLERLTAAIMQREDELLERALALGGRLYAEKPKAFSRRIKTYWLVWRGSVAK